MPLVNVLDFLLNCDIVNMISQKQINEQRIEDLVKKSLLEIQYIFQELDSMIGDEPWNLLDDKSKRTIFENYKFLLNIDRSHGII